MANKTATCALACDTSKFDGPIDSAKAKLASFGQAVQRTASVAQTALNIWQGAVNIAGGINEITKAVENLNKGWNSLKQYASQVGSVFAKIKSTASNLFGNLPTSVKVLGVSAIAAGVGLFATYKSLQLVVNLTKSAISGVSSLTNKFYQMAKASASSVASSFSSALNAIGGVASRVGIALGGVGISLGALDRFFKIGITSAFELGDQYKTLSDRTGASIAFLYDFGKVLKNSGVSSEYAGTAIAHMQRALTGLNELGQPTNQIFSMLGLKFEDLIKLSPEQQLIKIGHAINNLGSEAEKTKAATEIFGRAGYGLKGAFKDVGFDKLSGNFSETGMSLQRNAANMAKVATLLRDSGSMFRGFFVEIGGAIAPSILELFKMFGETSVLSAFGKKLGEQLSFAINVFIGAFKSGQLLSLLEQTFKVGGMILRDYMKNAFDFIGRVGEKLFESDLPSRFFSGFFDVLVGISKMAIGLLWTAFKTPLTMLQAGMQTVFENAISFFISKFPPAKKIFGIEELKASSFAENYASIKASGGAKFFGMDISKLGGEGVDEVAKGYKNLFSVYKDEFSALSGEFSRFGGVSEDTKRAMADLSGKASSLAVSSGVAAKATEEASGTQFLLPKTGQATAREMAISSLRRIGGGGGAFGGDPMLSLAQQQLGEAKKQTSILQKASQSMFAQQPQGMVGSFLSVPAVLSSN